MSVMYACSYAFMHACIIARVHACMCLFVCLYASCVCERDLYNDGPMTHAYARVCVRAWYMYMYISMCISMHMIVHMHVYIDMHMLICMHIAMHTRLLSMHLYICVCMCTCICRYMEPCVYVHVLCPRFFFSSRVVVLHRYVSIF